MTEETFESEFNKFIMKWCGSNSAHLLDTDENDGERIRQLHDKEIEKIIKESEEHFKLLLNQNIEELNVQINTLKHILDNDFQRNLIGIQRKKLEEKDKEMIVKDETIKFQLNGIKDLNEEIERLKGIIKLETSQNKENIQNIIKLQAEVKRLKDFPLNKLKKGW